MDIDANAVKRALADCGLRSTPQRYAVMALLMQQAGHTTAAEIFEAVDRLDSRSSRATIYNNLRDLVQAGLVREVAVGAVRHDLIPEGMRHYHFICDRCTHVEDVDWYDVPRPAAALLGKGCFANASSSFGGCAAGPLRDGLPLRISNSKERIYRWIKN